MSAEADHEVIDSPEALLRHLYEEHGVEEARDLDPETAPVQFWVRRHAELERAQRVTRRDDEPPPPPEPWPAPAARPQPVPRTQPAARAQPEAARGAGRPDPVGTGREGRRPAAFGDPLVEAMARALAGRGHDEAAVRAAIRSFAGPGGGAAGEAAVRAVLVEPMLRSAAERLLGGGGPRQPASRRGPDPAASPDHPPPPPRDEPARPEAAWAGLWSDLANPGRRPATGAGPADDDELMAVANAVQQRRRVRRRRR